MEAFRFFSRKLTPAELKYAAFDRELLAAFATIQHFQELLECRSFQLWTDHKPLVATLESAATPKPPRRQRQMAYISEYTTDVVHTPGTSNMVADMLSRFPPTAQNATNSIRHRSGTEGADSSLYAALH